MFFAFFSIIFFFFFFFFFFSSRRRHTFFFQAEDGIRDRSPSRGLGDVYKRQFKNCFVVGQLQVVVALSLEEPAHSLYAFDQLTNNV